MWSSGLGGSVVSNNILQNNGKLKCCIKEQPVNALDNGWRFLSDIDTAEVLWRVKKLIVDYPRLPYEQMVIQGDEIRATDFYGRRVYISENTGQILKRYC